MKLPWRSNTRSVESRAVISTKAEELVAAVEILSEVTDNDYATICKGSLFRNGVRLVVPARSHKFRDHILAAGVSLICRFIPSNPSAATSNGSLFRRGIDSYKRSALESLTK